VSPAFNRALAVVFYFSPILAVSDEDMQSLEKNTVGLLGHELNPLYKQHRLILAIWVQFAYVGTEGSRPLSPRYCHHVQRSTIAD